ncbi:MAG: NYN domain-containing protein [Candidatus Uhrbacteria bacterium]|nr:NYN domain-containing protein [Candidatus Uhrbacteria bacterium]
MRRLVIIDGSNFYHKAKVLAPNIHFSTFNYRKLFEDIAGSSQISIEYCVGEIRLNKLADEKARSMYAGQQTLFYYLQKQRIVVKKGFMLKNQGVYHEKGVDVRIAIDIVRGALKDEYDTCHVVSSDSDILPAIRDAMDVGKRVVYVAFEGSMVSRALAINCSYTKFITKSMLESCAV